MNTVQLERIKQVDVPVNVRRSVASHSSLYCCYTNRTAQLQIIRVATSDQGMLERVVMPQAHICFEADSRDFLEVHTGNPITSILTDRVPCCQLVPPERNST